MRCDRAPRRRASITYGDARQPRTLARARRAQRASSRRRPVDGAFWARRGRRGAAARARAPATRASSPCTPARDAPGKGVDVLLDAWRATGLRAPEAPSLALAGVAAERGRRMRRRVVALGHARARSELRNFYAAADVLVVPSVPTRSLPRAVGAGGQRGHVPAHPDHRHRRRRRRRRAASCATARPASSSPPATPPRSPRAIERLRARRGAARAPRRGGRRGGRAAYTPEAWADGVCGGAARRVSAAEAPASVAPRSAAPPSRATCCCWRAPGRARRSRRPTTRNS